ncbi:cell cycle checkpoint [Dichomitus squalens LYAD-421 SS1]|uniref:cell cycle checkpoint n=1 Tax=Dichomitus squalens (strain LYAD-421) TaxID=732165 RepID=UPI0004410D2A|nr:cell cycle checkpoint [Dichomitus squalens LYAD-421 SS1]EJF64406.1 cell cycle checkpoint [Dichomitus squalens LYAD-421 SS1]
MRFRATIENVDTFVKIVQSVEKLQRKCIIKFGEREMRIICTGDANEGGIQVWSTIKVSSLFTEYRVQSNSNNEITISVFTESLLSALHSAAASSSKTSSFLASDSEVIMKLAKNPEKKSVLSFEIKGTTSMGSNALIHKQLLIDVLRHADVDRLKEPLCPEPDVHILLPPLGKLRTVVERLRSLAAEGIHFRANHSGELQLSTSTENARLEVVWSGLTNPPMSRNPDGTQNTDESEVKDPAEMFGVLVSHKCLTKFLTCHVISSTTIACICANHCMILYVYIGNVADAGGVLTFYIPAQFDEPI